MKEGEGRKEKRWRETGLRESDIRRKEALRERDGKDGRLSGMGVKWEGERWREEGRGKKGSWRNEKETKKEISYDCS